MNRRGFLLGAATTGAVATSGCIGGGDENDEASSGPNNTTDEGNLGNETAGDGLTGNGNGNGTGNDTGNSSGDGNASGDEYEANVTPDENQTAIDRDQYEDQNVSATQERSIDEIDINASNKKHDDGTVVVEASVTNVSDTPIDYVDIYVLFFGPDDQYLTSKLIPFDSLTPDQEKSGSATLRAHEASADPARIELEVDVYDVK